jgi:hypothetical protein
MKKILLSFVLLLTFSLQFNAQTTAETLMNNYAEDAATVFCGCVNNSFSSFDEMAAEGSETKWVEVETCMGASEDELELKYVGLEGDTSFSDQKLSQLMLEKLSQMEGCDLAYSVAQMIFSEPAKPEDTEEHK